MIIENIIESKIKGIKFVEVDDKLIQTDPLKVGDKLIQTDAWENYSPSASQFAENVSSNDTLRQQFSPMTRFSEYNYLSPIENNVATQTDSLQFINQSTQTSINHVDQIIQAIPDVTNVGTQVNMIDTNFLNPNVQYISSPWNSNYSLNPFLQTEVSLVNQGVQTLKLEDYGYITAPSSPSEYLHYSGSNQSILESSISETITQESIPETILYIRNPDILFSKDINQLYFNKYEEIMNILSNSYNNQELNPNNLTNFDIYNIIHYLNLEELASSNINDTILIAITCFNNYMF